MGDSVKTPGRNRTAAMLGEAALLAATFPLAVLPLPVLTWLGAALGRLVFLLWPRRRAIAAANLEQAAAGNSLVLPWPPRETARRSFENLGRGGAEDLKLFHRLDESLLRQVRIEGVEHLREAKARDKGLIMITGHCGNWELLGVAVAVLLGESFSVVAREQNSAVLNRLIERMRTRSGNEVIYKNGAVRKLLAQIRAKRGVGILIDQAVLENEGLVVDFLGRPALTTKLPALIARKTGAPVLPCFIHRDEKNGGNVITFHRPPVLSDNPDPEQAVREDTARFTSYVEAFVREHPDQWLWGHRRWKRAGGDPA
ncbi:MAG: lysophospholipid acyltransferase family protein [Pseudomonadota bacterium]